jgi:hypothetical protein
LCYSKPDIIATTFGNNVGNFIADIGRRVYMSYGCNGSGASSFSYAAGAFSHYGYTPGSWTSLTVLILAERTLLLKHAMFYQYYIINMISGK